MRQLALGLSVGAALLLGGCAAGSERDAAPRIDSLDGRRVEVRRGAGAAVEPRQAADSYREFLALDGEDPALRVEAMRRLADLQLESSEAERGDGAATMEGMSFAEAVTLYEQVLERYPDYPHRDRILYQLGRAYEGNAQPERALAVLDRLVSGFPQTGYLVEAQFRRGEILFSAARYGEAESAYAAVLALGEQPQFYEESLYKHGWSLFKQSRHKESLRSFYRLLDRRLLDATSALGMRRLDSLPRAEHELVEDTLRAMAISYSYADGPHSVDADFATRPVPAYGFLVYQRLGNLYVDKERYTDAADSYRAFVARDPNHWAAPLLQMEAIDAYRKGGFTGLVLDGKHEFVERYRISGPFWQIHARADHPQVIEALKANLTDLARHHHARAQQSGAVDSYNVAARWYGEYLLAFPDDPEVAATNFLLAELLFEAGRYAEATEQYERTAYDYPPHPRSAEAGYAALLAYRRHEQTLGDVERAQWHARAIDSALRFADSFPQHGEVPGVLTTAAVELFEQREFERAGQVGRRVVALDPPVDAAKARTAWSVIAHSAFDLGRYEEAEQAYQSLLPLLAAEPASRAEIVERLASSVYKQAEQAQVLGDLELAVRHYQRVAEVAPASSVRVNADYDAAAVLVQLGDWERAIPALEQFRAVHPQHEFARQASHTLAIAFEETGRSARAAGELALIAEDPAEETQLRREAAWRSAELYAEAGDRAAAQTQYRLYVERYPQEFQTAMEARLRLADLADELDDADARRRWLEAIVQADAAAVGELRSERSRYLAAKASLELAAPQVEVYRNVRLVMPLDKSLQAKKGLMEQALAAYAQAAQYDIGEVTTAATHAIGGIYQEMSHALLESERPVGLDAEALEQYEILLEEQAFPFEEKAIEIYEANAARAADGLYDDWVRASYAELAQLAPGRYARPELTEQVVYALP